MQSRPSYLSSHDISTPTSVLPSLHLLENSEPPPDGNRRMTGKTTLLISDSMISPRACIQTSLKMIKSPRGSDQTTNDLVQPFKSLHNAGKQKRNTMPPTFAFPSSQQVHATDQALSPSRQPKRIQFTYVKSQPSSSQSQILARPCLTWVNEQKIHKKMMKMTKNRLCSNIFNISHSPVELYGRKRKDIERLLESMNLEPEMLTSKQWAQSHMTSAETVTSAVGDSQMTRGSRLKSSIMDNKTLNRQSSKNMCLADHLHSSKKLGNTMMFPQASYNFGGLLSNLNKESHSEQKMILMQQQTSSSSYEWNQLRGLLTEESGTDMKQSIHCSPDIRSTKYSLTMLQGFGREIEQSIVASHE